MKKIHKLSVISLVLLAALICGRLFYAIPAEAAAMASISVTQLKTNFTVGEVYQLSALAVDNTNWPVNPQPVFSWLSSDPMVGSVSVSGLFTAVAVGSVTLTASASGFSNSVILTVAAPVAPVLTSVHLYPLEAIIQTGSTQQFTATAYDSSSINPMNPQPTFTWASSNPAVGTVDVNGLFTGVSAGTSLVTASTGGLTATSTVTVVAAGGPTFKTITIILANGAGGIGANVPLGYTAQLAATAWDATGFYMVSPQPAFTWSSSNPAVATVDATGLFHAVANGYVTITAASQGISGTKSTVVGTGNLLNASAQANGSITPVGVSLANPGSNFSYNITPNAGYQIADVLVDGVSVGPLAAYTFTNVQTSHTISVSFSPVSAVINNLVIGWNLVGWSGGAIPAESIGAGNLGVDLVAKWDAVNQLWISHITGFPLNNFTINSGDGIFIHKN